LGTLVAAALATLAPLSGSASAIVAKVTVGAKTTIVGMQPRSISSPLQPPPSIVSFGNPTGAPVMHSSAVYAIYWSPEYGYHGDWEHSINTFLHGVGAASGSRGVVNAVTEQYTDKTNAHAAYASTFRGAYSDVKPFPSNGCEDPDLAAGFPDEKAQYDNVACLTDAQLREELQEFIAKNGLHTGMGTIFFLLTPPGVTVCVEKGESISAYCSDNAPAEESSGHSFCSYHSDINPTSAAEGDASTILYAVIPWTAGGIGDFQLFDGAPGYECQDGGFDPSSKEEIEEPEANRHQQEPNQLSGRSGDGGFDSGLSDLVINQVSVEQRNVITNPLLNAWQDSKGNEVVDECRNFFAAIPMGGLVEEGEGAHTGAGTLSNQSFGEQSYYLNATFNFASLLQRYPGIPCIHGIGLQPQFTAPNPVNAGDIVGFDGAESNTTLDAGAAFDAKGVPYEVYPTYTWNFGDGATSTSPYPPGASPIDEPSAFHSYQYGGSYDVTLTVTDVGGNVSTTSQTITVIGPPPPPPPPAAPAAPQAPAAPAATGSATAAGTGSTSALTAPRVSEKVASHSLKKVLRQGLAVGYYVNEQVAGGLEVMLDARTARRLHIKGPIARNLPQGYPRSIVLGGAVVVTTTAGHGMLRVKFSKQVTKRLAHIRKLKVTMRIVVRNADRQSPKTATLLSVVVLKG
jgi:hypothetical protein